MVRRITAAVSSLMAVVERVMLALEQQRQQQELLLRALATDLTTEIRGERIRFVEAMQQATSVNVQRKSGFESGDIG